MVCDTLEHVQRFVGLRGDGMEASVALQTVNNKSRGSTACDIALVAFTDSKPIAVCVIQGRFAAIVQIMCKLSAMGRLGERCRPCSVHCRGRGEGQII
jgi:hypothetical protein